MKTAPSSLAVAAAVLASPLLAGMTANAANLVNKGGTSDVPTYQGRVHYIKPLGSVGCPPGLSCFCDSGSYCTLPGTGIITGTVVIDRPGVTLDCQNRIIQPPRYSGSRQQCTQSSQCGRHSNGRAHSCVNGFCQLSGLAGVNVGGPVQVNDPSISIDVLTTGYVQDVTVVNCTVRNHHTGYRVTGFEGDNGLDELVVNTSELRTNVVGLDMYSTDDSDLFGNDIHDNTYLGMNLDYNWGIGVRMNWVQFNLGTQIYFDGEFAKPNQWLQILVNVVESGPPSDAFGEGNVIIGDTKGGGAPCDAGIPTGQCDIYFEANTVRAHNAASEVHFSTSYSPRPTAVLRDNVLFNGLNRDNVSFTPDASVVQGYCWMKGDNSCYRMGDPINCRPSGEFGSPLCWY
jgi:hypothetical protein